MKDRISLILSGFALLSIIVGGLVRFAIVEGKVIKTEKTILQLEERLDNKIITDQIESKQERIWKLEDRYEQTKEETLKEEIRKINQEIDNLQRQIDGNKENKEKEGTP